MKTQNYVYISNPLFTTVACDISRVLTNEIKKGREPTSRPILITLERDSYAVRVC